MKKNCIRVLIIVDYLYKMAGVPTFLMSYYRHIPIEKCHFDFLINESVEESFEEEVRRNGSNVYKLPSFKIKNVLQIIKEADIFFKEHNEYDIIHCHASNVGFLYFYLAKKHGYGIRIQHSHATKAGNTKFTSIRNLPLRYIGINLASNFAACSVAAGRFMFGDRKFKLIKNAIDCNKFGFSGDIRSELRKKYGIKNDEVVIGQVGRVNYQKNQKFSLSVFEKVLKENKRYKLVIIGDGPDLEGLKRAYSGIDNILFLGEKENVSEYYNMMDIVIQPSRFEGLPITMIEEQCNGLKILSSDKITDEVKVSDLVDFFPLNEDVWVKKILEYADYHRYTRREELKENGYDIECEASKLYEYYNSLLENR